MVLRVEILLMTTRGAQHGDGLGRRALMQQHGATGLLSGGGEPGVLVGGRGVFQLGAGRPGRLDVADRDRDLDLGDAEPRPWQRIGA